MTNRFQFPRQTAAFLLASGLIVGLLLGHAAAQDLSTQEARAAWLTEQFRGAPIGSNAKFGAVAALARLALNPDDAEVISSITHFYDKVPEGKNGQQFSYPGVAWVLGKYWDKFTPAQRDHLKARLKGFSDLLGHGTENHALMKGVAAYLFAQYWPDENGWMLGTHTSAQLMEEARKNLLAVMRSLYDYGYVENLSTTYAAVHLFPYYALYDCATDPEVKTAADAAIHFHVTNIAANHFKGVVIPPYNRQNTWQVNTHTPGTVGPTLQWIYWLYWAEVQNRVPVGQDFVRLGENQYVVYAALSNWRPPAAINSLARGQTVPYELTASARGWIAYWGIGDPAKLMGLPGECVRYVYRDKLYAMGSGFFQYNPRQYNTDYNAFGIIYKSPDQYNYIECYHPYWYSNDRAWKGINSPFMQWAQHRGTAIALFDIPVADPWEGLGTSGWLATRDNHFDDLIQETLVRYPQSIDEKTEANGWIFLREGDVYIAIRPLKAYTIDANYKQPGAGAQAAGADGVVRFDVVRSAFARTGFVFDIATKEEFATFEAFQRAVNRNPFVVDWDQLSVAYTNVKGDTLTATWNPPDYQATKTRVLIRPEITVNGTVVPIDTTYPVLKSPSVNVADGVMRLATPAGRLEVDWRGKAPSFSPKSLWKLANENKDILRISTWISAHHVSTEEGLNNAIDWCKKTGVTRVFLGAYDEGSKGELAKREILERARARFEAEGIEGAGLIVTKWIGTLSSHSSMASCYTSEETRKELQNIFEYTASIFDLIMIDDWFFTDCECEDCQRARGDRSWSEYRCNLINEVSRDNILKPAKAVNPNVRIINKFPCWYDDLHQRGYDVLGRTPQYDLIWAGNESRDYDFDVSPIGEVQYQSYFNMRWIGSIGGGKTGGGWFDALATTPKTYLEQSRQTVLGDAKEMMLCNYNLLTREINTWGGRAFQGTGIANVEALRRELPGLFELAKMVRNKPIKGILATKPANSNPYDNIDAMGGARKPDAHVYDFVGMLGLPLVPSTEIDTSADAAFFPFQVLQDPTFPEKLQAMLTEGKPVLITAGLAERLGNIGEYDNLMVLPVEGDTHSLLKLSREELNAIRDKMLEPIGIRFDAPAKVGLYLMGDDIVVLENFNDEPVDVTISTRFSRKAQVKLVLPQEESVRHEVAGNKLVLNIPPRTLVAINYGAAGFTPKSIRRTEHH